MQAILLAFICIYLHLPAFICVEFAIKLHPRPRVGRLGGEFYGPQMPNAAPIEASSKDKRDFVLANTRLISPPLTPEIRLRLADEAVPIWRKTEEELGAMGLPPPFWAFAWAGGQALARYALDHPALVQGKRALDFASGSGLVAIAAAKAGAARDYSLRHRRLRRRRDRGQHR